jgi:mannose-6-phosphate isomerase-like protein (cupin superfamily)
MPRLIPFPTNIEAAGSGGKTIREYAGDPAWSVARMTSPAGWSEPGQRPDFDECTLVLSGMVRVEHEGGVLEVRAGQAVLARKGEWVRYSTPEPEGADYVAVCVPAFSPETVHREDA